jgi:hypothetical protein
VDLQFILSLVLGLAGGVAGSWLAFRIRFERLEATLEEREKHRIEDKVGSEARFSNHSDRLLNFADHETRIKIVEAEVTKLRDAYHNFRRDEIENVFALFRKWKDELAETFVRKK